MKESIVFICDVCQHFDTDKNLLQSHEEWCISKRDRAIAERKAREACGQLTIGQIIQKLEALPELPIQVLCLEKDLSPKFANEYNGKNPHYTDSYRGIYEELAISVAPSPAIPRKITTKVLLAEMKDSLNRTYCGWKGGEFTMSEDTFVWVSQCGESSGLAVVDIRLTEWQTIQLVVKQTEL